MTTLGLLMADISSNESFLGRDFDGDPSNEPLLGRDFELEPSDESLLGLDFDGELACSCCVVPFEGW